MSRKTIGEQLTNKGIVNKARYEARQNCIRAKMAEERKRKMIRATVEPALARFTWEKPKTRKDIPSSEER